MSKKYGCGVCVLLAGFVMLPAIAHASDCTGLPTSFSGNEFPTGDFFSNFNNPCYSIALGSGHGSTEYGDLNAIYFQTYYRVDPRYQLIIIGSFPNARYFSVTLYDDHSALSQSILDTSMVPLNSNFVNPYLPGVPFAPHQHYAVPINFGGTPGTQQAGCNMDNYNVSVNGLDGTQRHPGMDWNSNTEVFQEYPTLALHSVDTPQHTNPNTAGVILVRAYMDISGVNYPTSPHIIVRDVASGCAYPAAYAISTLQVTGDYNTGSHWMNNPQFQAHSFYASTYLAQLCESSPAPPNAVSWWRQPEYVAGANPDASYIVANLPQGLPASLAAGGKVMRVRVRVPVTPPTPCTTGCSRSGDEQMRYMSLSFMWHGGNTLASIADSAFTKDANGYATLIVGTGATIPAWITPANGYTYLDLTSIRNYENLSLLDLRHMIPAGGFNCAGQNVPFRMSVATPSGGLMGDYVPVVDYPVAAALPQAAAALVGPGGCGVFVAGQPGPRGNCAVLPAPPLAVHSVITQCAAPGCNQFVAQANPPVTISGMGFGQFPDGVPFTGTSDYLQILNITEGWSAGYTGSACTVYITSWANRQIQLTANVNQNGLCPLAPQDQLGVRVWNPQTMTAASLRVTVAAP